MRSILAGKLIPNLPRKLFTILSIYTADKLCLKSYRVYHNLRNYLDISIVISNLPLIRQPSTKYSFFNCGKRLSLCLRTTSTTLAYIRLLSPYITMFIEPMKENKLNDNK